MPKISTTAAEDTSSLVALAADDDQTVAATPSTFDDLPQELVRMILTCVLQHDDIKATWIVGLRFVCQSFEAVLTVELLAKYGYHILDGPYNNPTIRLYYLEFGMDCNDMGNRYNHIRCLQDNPPMVKLRAILFQLLHDCNEHAELIGRLLNHGVTCVGIPPLVFAILRRDSYEIKRLIKLGQSLQNVGTYRRGKATLFTAAAAVGSIKIIKQLDRAGAKLCLTDRYTVKVALQHGYWYSQSSMEILRWLDEKGFSPYWEDLEDVYTRRLQGKGAQGSGDAREDLKKLHTKRLQGVRGKGA